ncbi:hypothetical protein CIB48_g5749 [Xylaria polymorpha]|nr:hypothetical protein CIB48_g5749 [Xylaria polymorpha]
MTIDTSLGRHTTRGTHLKVLPVSRYVIEQLLRASESAPVNYWLDSKVGEGQGLAFAICQFASSLVKGTAIIYRSGKANSEGNEALEDIYGNLSQFSAALKTTDSTGQPKTSRDQNELESIAKGCRTDSELLLSLISKLKMKNGRPHRWASFQVALKEVLARSEIWYLRERIEGRMSQKPVLQLSRTTISTGKLGSVRSPIDKPVRAELVVGSVTTSESSVLNLLNVCTSSPEASTQTKLFPAGHEQVLAVEELHGRYPFQQHLSWDRRGVSRNPSLSQALMTTPAGERRARKWVSIAKDRAPPPPGKGLCESAQLRKHGEETNQSHRKPDTTDRDTPGYFIYRRTIRRMGGMAGLLKVPGQDMAGKQAPLTGTPFPRSPDKTIPQLAAGFTILTIAKRRQIDMHKQDIRNQKHDGSPPNGSLRRGVRRASQGFLGRNSIQYCVRHVPTSLGNFQLSIERALRNHPTRLGK